MFIQSMLYIHKKYTANSTYSMFVRVLYIGTCKNKEIYMKDLNLLNVGWEIMKYFSYLGTCAVCLPVEFCIRQDIQCHVTDTYGHLQFA